MRLPGTERVTASIRGANDPRGRFIRQVVDRRTPLSRRDRRNHAAGRPYDHATGHRPLHRRRPAACATSIRRMNRSSASARLRSLGAEYTVTHARPTRSALQITRLPKQAVGVLHHDPVRFPGLHPRQQLLPPGTADGAFPRGQAVLRLRTSTGPTRSTTWRWSAHRVSIFSISGLRHPGQSPVGVRHQRPILPLASRASSWRTHAPSMYVIDISSKWSTRPRS